MSANLRLLVVDDDPEIRRQIKWGFDQAEVVEAGSRAEAVSAVKRFEPQIVLLDLGLPPAEHEPTEGLKTLEEIRRAAPHCKVIVVSGQDQREIARKAIANGATDFFSKPINLEHVRLVVDRAVELVGLERENTVLSTRVDATDFPTIIAASPQMSAVCNAVRRLARTNVNVLLNGESGTGKELFARAVHELSPRRDRPFVAINCAAIPEQLLESELFGHEKGAFTGAYRQTSGKIEFANAGTLFLDEIGELALGLQAKLLRFIEERSFERVGGRKTIGVDVRIVVATNRNLPSLIAAGNFREDLFFRLNEVAITIPPLRARTGDAVLLAHHFVGALPASLNTSRKKLSSGAIAAIAAHAWPGNVRELQNRTKRALIMCAGDVLEPEDFELAPIENTVSLPSLRDERRRVERELLTRALAQCHNNLTQVAKVLGISRPTLYDLMRSLDMQPPQATSHAITATPGP
jgi:two-component system NtrC family response regulator